jgi:hypothetical protein
MSNHRDEHRGAIPDESAGANPRPERRRGGHELPDDIQDRPEQNAGYDEAVHHGEPAAAADEWNVEALGAGDSAGDLTLHEVDVEQPDTREGDDPDARAERDVIAEVRRRERRRP